MAVEPYRFLVADFADDIIIDPPDTVSLWRAYAFTFKEETYITSLIGGCQILGTDPPAGYVALLSCTEEGVPTDVLALATIQEEGRRQVFHIDSVKVEPGNWYMIAQGATEKTYYHYHPFGGTYIPNTMSAVGYWDVNEMMAELGVFSDWQPGTTEDFIYMMYVWLDSQGPVQKIIGKTPITTGEGVTDARPDLGFYHGWYRSFSVYPKVAGSYRTAQARVKVKGSWKNVSQGWIKEGGVWKPIVP